MGKGILKDRGYIVLVLLVSFGFWGNFKSFATAETANLLPNPGFEKDEDGNEIPDGWIFYNSGGVAGSQGIGIWDNSVFHSGKKSVKIEKTNEKVYSSWMTNCSAKPLTRYKISLWYKSEAGHGRSQIGIYDKNASGQVSASISAALPASQDWELFEKEFNSGHETVSFQIQLRVSGGKGITWYDDVSLMEIGPARKRPVSLQSTLIRIPEEEAKELIKKAVYIAEDSKLNMFAGSQRIKDNTSRDGSCGRIDGNAPPYFNITWAWDMKELIPGLSYTLYTRVKVKKIGEGGTAFRCGVYDNVERLYIARDMRPLAKDVGNMAWETYQIGTFEFRQGQITYVGPTKNVTNIPEIFVDYFFILPGDESSKNFWENENKYKNRTTRFYLTTDREGFVSLRLQEKDLNLGYLVTDDKREQEETFTGLILDYHTKKGYTKRVLLSLGLCGRNIKRGKGIALGYGKEIIDEVKKLFPEEQLGKYQTLNIDLSKYAPGGWDGETWFTLAIKESLATFSGHIIKPARDEMEILEYKILKEGDEEVGLDIESLNYLSDKIKSTALKSGIEKLKALQK